MNVCVGHVQACILVHEPKKQFYRKFLYEPFPVESHLKVGGCVVVRGSCKHVTWLLLSHRTAFTITSTLRLPRVPSPADKTLWSTSHGRTFTGPWQLGRGRVAATLPCV